MIGHLSIILLLEQYLEAPCSFSMSWRFHINPQGLEILTLIIEKEKVSTIAIIIYCSKILLYMTHYIFYRF
jgi:hypothetical protein